MTSDRWHKLKSILADALEKDSNSDRTAVINQSCADDDDLLREVESLIAEADAADAFEECAEGLAIDIPADELSDVGQRVGPYVIIRQLGRGGMGTVYLAARADGYFQKEVAVKVLNRGSATEEVVRRFRAEREVLARLDHPNIARLMDAGTMGDGRPYFVMEYVEGVPITSFVEEKALPISERLKLFLKICAAVEAAHRNSVIHRDLKPSNILVSREGEPKLLDFGIAKLVRGKSDSLEITSFKQQRLTPTAASPEQVSGKAVTIYSDIYALGVVLYEILTGIRPHDFDTTHPTDEELVEVVCHRRPIPPSDAVTARSQQRQLRGDLDAILLHALQKDPSRRYQSVEDFAEDVRRHLVGKPVRARGRDLGYKIRTALAHDGRVQMAAALSVLGLAGIVGGVFFRAHLNRVGAQAAIATEKIGIAVLPFDSFPADQQNRYFADGVQEAILTNLANVSALKVISRGSVASYRETEKKETEIGRVLGVSYVLEGIVQKTGDDVRVDAHLIDTRTGATIWAQQYDRKMNDLFAVESDLAQAIASQLKGKLSEGEKAAIENRPTRDMVAYDLYLRARESFFQDNFGNAVHLLDQAVARDPQFALAYSLLAQVDLYIYRFGSDLPADKLTQAKKAAETALRLAPKLPQSHLAIAQYYYYGLRQYKNALTELDVARGLGGEQAEFVDLSALIERRLGHWKDAIRDGERAAELDPQNPFVINELVESYLSVRRFSDAERTAEIGINSGVTRSGHLWILRAEAFLSMGKIDEARAVMDSCPEDMGRLNEQIWIALFAKDFTRASQLLSQTPPSERKSYNIAFLEGLLARAQGDSLKARSSFQAARDRVLGVLGERPNDPDLISQLSMADAGLGRKEDALRGAKRVLELCPVTKDAVDGANYATMLALVYAWTGENDAALSELEKMASLPRSQSWGELRFNPWWDDVRKDPRFDQLLTQAALPAAYN